MHQVSPPIFFVTKLKILDTNEVFFKKVVMSFSCQATWVMYFKSGSESLFKKQSLRKCNHTCFIKKGVTRWTELLLVVSVGELHLCYSDNI